MPGLLRDFSILALGMKAVLGPVWIPKLCHLFLPGGSVPSLGSVLTCIHWLVSDWRLRGTLCGPGTLPVWLPPLSGTAPYTLDRGCPKFSTHGDAQALWFPGLQPGNHAVRSGHGRTSLQSRCPVVLYLRNLFLRYTGLVGKVNPAPVNPFCLEWKSCLNLGILYILIPKCSLWKVFFMSFAHFMLSCCLTDFFKAPSF